MTVHQRTDSFSIQAEAYLVAVGVGGGPVAQLSSRPVGSAARAHTGVAPGRGGKVGLAAGTHHANTCMVGTIGVM